MGRVGVGDSHVLPEDERNTAAAGIFMGADRDDWIFLSAAGSGDGEHEDVGK